MQAGEFTEIIKEYHPETAYPEVIARHPGSRSVTAHYVDKDGTVIAELHYFRMTDGSVIPTRVPVSGSARFPSLKTLGNARF